MNPLPAWLQKLWVEWDIRMMILVSLILQIILICFGGRRKNIRGIWIEAVVWSTYLMADSAALFALGKLSDASGNDDSCEDKKSPNNNGLMVLWPPLLLLHLGGPDTITAYSIEDVSLWLRHALGVVLDAGLVIYVFLRFWTGKSEWVAFLTFPLFVAGIVKYSERTYVLWCTNSAFPQPLLPIPFSNANDVVDGLSAADDSDAKLVVLSYLWLQALAPCISSSRGFDRRLTSSEVKSFIWREDSTVNDTTFKFFEIQLGFMYDVLYTKASRIYTKAGCIVRLISFVCLAGALLGFIIISKDDYSSMDAGITYVLLVGAIVLELYAFLLIICSDLAIVWMCKHFKIPLVKRISQLIAPLVVRHVKRWTGSLPTLNLLNLALHETKPAMLQKVTKFFEMDEKFKAFMCQGDVYEFEPLKLIIMKKVRFLLEFFCHVDNWHGYFGKRDREIDRRLNGHRQLKWSYTEKSFDISIVILHIATNYCYYLDHDNNDSTKDPLCEGSKLLSDYMMYLLVSHPYMLGNNVTACDFSGLLGSYFQLMEEAKKEGFSKVEVCRKMIELEPTVCTPSYSGSAARLSSIEYGRIHIDVCDLVTILMDDDFKNKKWDSISELWVLMLFQGAADCELRMHLQQLRRGGEFISQVWLLLYIHGLIYESPRDFLRPLFGNINIQEV